MTSADSWVTIAYADTYFSKKYDSTFWATKTDLEKEQLLITAKNFILQIGYNIQDNETSEKVKKAQCEISQFIFEFYGQWRKRVNLIASGVTDFSVSNFSESLQKQIPPVYISNLLSDFDTNSGTYIAEFKREINS